VRWSAIPMVSAIVCALLASAGTAARPSTRAAVGPSGLSGTDTIRRIAGIPGAVGFSGDGGPALKAKLDAATDVAVDSKGSVYIADRFNNRVRKVTPSGTITTFAGNGPFATPGGVPPPGGFSGDGGPAAKAQLDEIGRAHV